MREIIAEMPAPTESTGPMREVPNVFPKNQQRAFALPEFGPLRARGVQTERGGGPAPAITFSFDGVGANGFSPPDTNGDVSPNEYLQWVNIRWAILDKVTGARSATVAGNSFWAGFGGTCQTTNNGDPIALWDDRAGRWVVSQFVVSDPGSQCFAVSATSDPLGAYHRYQFNLPLFGDYPHIGIWSDGGKQSAYTMVTHDFSPPPRSFQGASLIAVERDKMLNGQPAAIVRFSGLDQYGMQPAHLEGVVDAPTGACPVFVHFDSQTAQYVFYDICLNWLSPTSSTLNGPTFLTPRFPFVPRFEQIPQQSSSAPLDAFGTNTMYRASARAFPEGAPADISMVINHGVLGPDEQGSIKWVQFNLNGGPVAYPNGAMFLDSFEQGGSALPSITSKQLFDEGTFAPDTDNRWMGGIAMDRSGNIAVGYSVSSATQNPEIRMTGRRLGDAPGVLLDEQTCTPPNTGAQLSTGSRWGDYASMSVDPADECTFWFTSEYFPTTSTSTWSTRVCAFKFPNCGLPTLALVADSPTRVELCGTPTPAAPTFDLRVGVLDGFSETITFSATGVPGGVTPSFNPMMITPPGSTVLTLNGAESLASGEYAFDANANGSTQGRVLTLELGVSEDVAAAPTPTAPANAATGVKVRPTLTWTAVPGAVTYRVEVSTTNTFATLVASDVVTETSWAVNVGLDSSTEYFWRVRADNYCGEGSFSSTFSFTTGVPGQCPAGSTLTNVFMDDFQSGVNGWTTDGTGGTAWTQQAAVAGTGMSTTVWRVPNNSVTSDRGLISPSIVIPTSGSGVVAAFLSFDAHYSFETGDPAPGCWDGAALEARTSGVFEYLTPNLMLAKGYTGVLLAGAPLAGREVWCRLPTPVPARSIVDLDGYIGETVQLRFRATSDSNTTAGTPNGMSIDNLRVDVCID